MTGKRDDDEISWGIDSNKQEGAVLVVPPTISNMNQDSEDEEALQIRVPRVVVSEQTTSAAAAAPAAAAVKPYDWGSRTQETLGRVILEVIGGADDNFTEADAAALTKKTKIADHGDNYFAVVTGMMVQAKNKKAAATTATRAGAAGPETKSRSGDHAKTPPPRLDHETML